LDESTVKLEPEFQLGATSIDDTFAEAFGMMYARLIVTAHDDHWLDAAIREFAGFSSSVIACDLEIGVERHLAREETPDGRLGASLLCFGFSRDAIAKALPTRTGQCLMTCPTTAVFNGLPETEKQVALGKHIRYFGDGFQKSKVVGDLGNGGRRYWRIPVMDGEFVVEDKVGTAAGVAGGNIIIQATNMPTALNAVRLAIEAINESPGVITPFPGGVARSGSKVGSRYKALKASTADAYCPTLRGRVETKLHPDANCALEIVIDGVDESSVAAAMRTGMIAAAADNVVAISAGNSGCCVGFSSKVSAISGKPSD